MRRVVFLLLLIALLVPRAAVAQAPADQGPSPKDSLLSATVVFVADEQEIVVLGETQILQTLELSINGGPRKGEIVTVEQGAAPSVHVVRYKAGDRVYVRQSQLPDGTVLYEIATRDRTFPLLWMALVFVALVVLAGGPRGARSLVGLVLSFVVIFYIVLPRVGAAQAPVWTALLGCGLAMPVSYYLSHGLNRKTTIALIGSALGLGLTALIAVLFVAGARLTGFSGDEAGFVQSLYGGIIDMRGLLLEA